MGSSGTATLVGSASCSPASSASENSSGGTSSIGSASASAVSSVAPAASAPGAASTARSAASTAGVGDGVRRNASRPPASGWAGTATAGAAGSVVAVAASVAAAGASGSVPPQARPDLSRQRRRPRRPQPRPRRQRRLHPRACRLRPRQRGRVAVGGCPGRTGAPRGGGSSGDGGLEVAGVVDPARAGRDENGEHRARDQSCIHGRRSFVVQPRLSGLAPARTRRHPRRRSETRRHRIPVRPRGQAKMPPPQARRGPIGGGGQRDLTTCRCWASKTTARRRLRGAF